MRRKLLSLLAVPAMTAAMALAGAGSAAAYSGPHYWMYTDDGNPGGKVEFWPDGDIFKVCDIQADGAHVHVVLYDIETYKGYDITASGNGNCTTRRASDGAGFDLPEKGRSQGCISVNIRLWKGSSYVWDSEDKANWWNDNDNKDDC
jgi:hypothetical protein